MEMSVCGDKRRDRVAAGTLQADVNKQISHSRGGWEEREAGGPTLPNQ